MQEAAKKPLPLIVPIRPTLRRMMGASVEGALDTSQRSAEAAPQGEREGGRHAGVLSNVCIAYTRCMNTLARRFT